MSAYTSLDATQVDDLLTLYDIGFFEAMRPVRVQTANSNYYLKTDQAEYLLRIHEGRSFRDLIYEKEALLFLQKHPLPCQSPAPVANLYGGHFTPVSDSHYVSMYRWLSGRSLANWELDCDHCQQAGQILANLHQVGRAFKGHRRHPDRPERIFAQLDTLGWNTGPQRPGWWSVAAKLRPQLHRDLGRRVQHSLLHGEMSPANVKVRRGKINALFDFETVSRGPVLYDLAVALNFWAWDQSQSAYDSERFAAFVAAYQQLRPLTALQRSLLLSWMRFAALRFAVVYTTRFEGRAPAAADSYFRDFRPFAKRLQVLEAFSQRDFVKEFMG